MKNIFFIFVALFSVNTFAMDENKAAFDKQILEALISQAGQIELYERESPEAKSGRSLVTVLAEALLSSNGLNALNDEYVLLGNTSVSCGEADGAAGSTYMTCSVAFTNGDYIKTMDGYQGPEVESADIIEFTIRISNESGKVEVHGDKAYITLAG